MSALLRWLLAAAIFMLVSLLASPASGAGANGDSDGDGFDDGEETFAGTLPLEPCSLTPAQDDEDPDAWPADLNDDQTSDILDIVKLTPPYFNTSPPDPNYSPRKDFNGDSAINILDIVRMTPPVFNSQCTPMGCNIEPCCNIDSDLTICIETDKLIYGFGEPVAMTLHVTNTGASPQTFFFNDTCTSWFHVFSGSTEIWDSDLVCALILTEITLGPGESFTPGDVWGQIYEGGGQVPAGYYHVFGEMLAPCGNVPPCGAPFGIPVSKHVIRILEP